MHGIARTWIPFSLTCLLTAAAPPQGAPVCPADPLELASPFTASLAFSQGLAIDGDVLVVGSSISPSSSAVAVYERDQGGPGAWGQVATLLPSTGGAGLSFGTSVDVAGDTLAVGSPGERLVYVHGRDQGGAGAWGLVKTLSSPAPDPVVSYGATVAVAGDTLAVSVSGPVRDAVLVYERDQGGPGNWGQVALLLPSSPTFGNFGQSISIAGDTLAVGDDLDSALGGLSGAVTVFERTAGNWSFAQQLDPPNAVGGQTFGRSVALDGDTLLVGADNAGTAGPASSGAAWIYRRDLGGPGVWGVLTRLEASDPQAAARFGLAVALSAELAVVGAPTYDEPACTNIGRTYYFARDLGGIDQWGQVAPLPAPGTGCGDNFGRTLALAGRVAAVGAPNTPAPSGTGVVHVYDQITDDCTVPYCTAGTSSVGCRATMSASGMASSSSGSGLQLTASGLGGQQLSLVYFGTGGPLAKPWAPGSTSLLCVLGPVTRAVRQSTGGTAGLCDGLSGIDFNAWMAANPSKAPPAGATVHAQVWYSDAAAPKASQLSNAIQFPVGP